MACSGWVIVPARCGSRTMSGSASSACARNPGWAGLTRVGACGRTCACEISTPVLIMMGPGLLRGSFA
eukprot:scaffold238724_cov31-Tisochrysis_lutea.AAC.3